MSEPSGRILVVEDDVALRAVLVTALERAGHRVSAVGDGMRALEALRGDEALEIVLLDIGLPFVDGWKILEELEPRRRPSVVVISARGDEADKVRALDLGADDYLTKPFGAGELLARVRAVLRRVRPAADDSAGVVEVEDVRIDLRRRVVLRDGAEVHLSPTEYVLLAELARHAGEVVDQRTLLTRVWGPSYVGDRAYLRTFVQRLRRKLEADPSAPTVIVTVGRQGYRLGPVAGVSTS